MRVRLFDVDWIDDVVVVMLADAPVVVIDRSPVIDEPPIVTAPAFEMVFEPELLPLTVKFETAVSIGVPAEPTLPPLFWKLTVPDVNVKLPDLLTLPVLVILIVPPEPVETLLFIAI